MVDPYQLVLGVIALCLVVLTPIGFVLLYEGMASSWDGGLRGWRGRLRQALQRRRNLRALKQQTGVPLERLVADLRRLRRVIETDEHRSAAHQLGNRLAYDRVLIDVCQMLGIEHDLDSDLSGLDRDIERFRVEADLERAGVVLGDRRFGQAA